MRAIAVSLFLSAALAALVSCGRTGGSAAPSPAELYNPQALPSGALGDSIRYGHDLIVNTRQHLKPFVTANMDCAACHIAGGTKVRGGSFIGTYAYFPQWNKRAKRIITLQDRLAECFLYSMNGHPPNYASKEMVAMVAYIAWLSRGTPSFSTPNPQDRIIEPLPSASPDVAHGRTLYAQKCATCHQADGAGAAPLFPPLWGPTAFNNGAGMAHIDRMTGFVHYNMPQDAPGSLSLQDAYDVSAFVLTHERPAFKRNALVHFEPLPASYY